MTPQPSTNSFYSLGLAPKLLEILDKKGYKEPTPIQSKSIPIAIQGKDVIGIAQTGTGKTLAFALPMLMRLAAVKGRGLVILPTRELAIQVEETFQKIGKTLGLRTVVLIGGASMFHQINGLKLNPQVIIATPGRLIDHMEQKRVSLKDVSVLVLDEADRMLDMGFMPQIQKILYAVPKDRQTMLFSATMPAEIMKIAAQHMKLPVRVEIARAGTAAEHVSQELFVVPKNDKIRLLQKVLGEYHGTVLVFSRTKHGAKRMTKAIRAMKHSAAEIHSDKSLSQRREALEGFKNGKYRVLVATDIASRGIDVKGIELVLNYDLPDQADDYVHRIGRTGRAGMTGHAISFATPEQGRDVREIEKLIRKQLPITKLPELPEGVQMPRYEEREPRQFGGRGGQKPRPFAQRHSQRRQSSESRGSSPSYGSRPSSHGTSSSGSAHGTSQHGSSPRPHGHSSTPRALGADGKPTHGAARPAHGASKPYAKKPYGKKPFAARQKRGPRTFMGGAGIDGGHF